MFPFFIILLLYYYKVLETFYFLNRSTIQKKITNVVIDIGRPRRKITKRN